MRLERLEAGPGGRPLVVVRGDGPDAPALAAEAALLARIAHPGVVRLVRAGEVPDGAFELVTALAGSTTLAEARLDAEEAASAVAAVAATVADLHDLGVVHGDVAPQHVALGEGGRPVLVGFHAAGTVADGRDPGDDVRGLGEVLAAVLGPPAGAAADWEPIPEHRFGRRRRWVGFTRRALLTLADQAMAEPPARPTARAFAAAVAELVAPGTTSAVLTARTAAGAGASSGARASATAEPPGVAGPDEVLAVAGPDDVLPFVAPGLRIDEPVRASELAGSRAGRRGLGALAVGALGAVGLGLVAAGVGALLGDPGTGAAASAPFPTLPGSSAPAPPAQGGATTTGAALPAGAGSGTPPTTTAGAPLPTVAAGAPCPTSSDGIVLVDPDGDGCPAAAAVDDGAVRVDAARYEVGVPGDVVVLGDWDCDGFATVAALRPASGEVFVFDGWASAGQDLEVPAATTVPGAVTAAAADLDGDGCPSLLVAGPDGATTEVATQP